MNKFAVLGIEQDHDVGTRYAKAFREKLFYRNPAVADRVRITSCFGNQATEPIVNKHVNARKFDFITGSGHGSPSQYQGQNKKPIWLTDTIPDGIKGSVVHLTICSAATELGVALVAAGARSFWGYTRPFAFVCRSLDNPLNDQVAQPFFEMDALIDSEIVAGRNAVEVNKALKTYFHANYLPMLSVGATNQAEAFLDNFTNLAHPERDKKWGDKDATLK